MDYLRTRILIMDNKTCKFLATTLQSYIVDRNELEETIPKIFQNNSYLTETYGKCLRQLSGDVADSSKSCTIIEIDSILDYLHDELNTGHWSEVPVAQRQGFTAASYIKAIILIIRVANGSEYYRVELLRDCLKCIDMGLLLGAPLTNNPDLLTDCARFLSERIGSVSECALTSYKRKHCDDSRRYRGDYDKLQKAIEIEALSKPSLQKFYRDYFVRQKPVKLLGRRASLLISRVFVMVYGHFIPRHFIPGQFTPKTFYTHDNSYPGHFMSKTIYTRESSYPE